MRACVPRACASLMGFELSVAESARVRESVGVHRYRWGVGMEEDEVCTGTGEEWERRKARRRLWQLEESRN